MRQGCDAYQNGAVKNDRFGIMSYTATDGLVTSFGWLQGIFSSLRICGDLDVLRATLRKLRSGVDAKPSVCD